MKPYYEESGITIYCGDWRECHLHKFGEFTLLLTDPPYGIGEAAGKNKSRGNLAVAKDYGTSDWDSNTPEENDVNWMRSLAKWQIIFGGNYMSLPPAKCWLVWDKINGANDFADCELAWTNLNKAVRQFRYMWNGMLREQPEERFHPTQKPLALMKWCISQTTSTGTIMASILDPYMGSGTTLVAAKDMGITAVGCEREEKYCEIAAKRLSQEVFKFDGVA
jgi:DNA modification methylase